MCNLYYVTTSQEAIRALFLGLDDKLGNLPPPSLNVCPDRLAPVVRSNGAGGLELVDLTWGPPTPPDHITPGAPDTGITNIRNLFFKDWLERSDVAHRCSSPNSRSLPSGLPLGGLMAISPQQVPSVVRAVRA